MPIRGGEPQPEKRFPARPFFLSCARRCATRPSGVSFGGLVIISLATHAWARVYPLYLKDEVGLDAGTIVQMQTFLLVGTLVSSYAWGWLADRFSGRLVLLSGVLAMGVLPLIWVAMPRHGELGIFWAAVAARAVGRRVHWVQHWQDRQLNVDLVPAKKRRNTWRCLSWTQTSRRSGARC